MKLTVFSHDRAVQTFSVTEGEKHSFPIPAQGDTTVIKIALPLVDIHGVWHCDMSEFQLKLPWVLQFSSAINMGMPFLAFFNSGRQLRYAVATDDLADDTDFTAALNQQDCTYDVTLTVSGKNSFNLILDCRKGISFQESLAQWRKDVIAKDLHFPPEAWDPVFCSWYAVHGGVTAAWLEGQGKLARELGFGTLIVDDGWCYDEVKRVTPETLPDWYSTIGDWEISQIKFPDFKEHVRKMQRMGFKYLLWVAPHFLGRASKIYKEHPDWALDDLHEGCRHLDIAKEEAVDAVVEKLVRLAAENGLDGLKIDFLDVVLASAGRPVGRNTGKMMERLAAGLRDRKPDSLIEYRQGYATIGALPYATQFRAGDVPFDWAWNFRRLADIRLSVGDGVPVHADPAYWAPEEFPENVARHMMVMLLGVPMLSMDLNALPEEQLAIVRHYMELYAQKRALLNFGHWEILFTSGNVGAAVVSNEREKLAIVMDPGCVPAIKNAAGTRELLLLNISAEPLLLDGISIAPGKDNFGSF